MNIQITDIKLPERSVPNILTILASNNMPVRVPDRDRYSFNCWGFTAYYFQWEETAVWLSSTRMEDHLEAHTRPISKEEIRMGDVAIFHYPADYLTHTAIVLYPGRMVCHKPGQLALCIDTIEAVTNSYGEATYARVIEKTEKTEETI